MVSDGSSLWVGACRILRCSFMPCLISCWRKGALRMCRIMSMVRTRKSMPDLGDREGSLRDMWLRNEIMLGTYFGIWCLVVLQCTMFDWDLEWDESKQEDSCLIYGVHGLGCILCFSFCALCRGLPRSKNNLF